MKTSALTGVALDWAVAKADEERDVLFCQRQYGRLLVRIAGDHETSDVEWVYAPSTDWKQGGPIIEREGISVKTWHGVWQAELEFLPDDDTHYRYGNGAGPTPLVAAMRCYVASKLGETIDIPEGLI
jgi:hypothetical protein